MRCRPLWATWHDWSAAPCGATLRLELTGAATLGLARAGEITLADHPDRDRELAASPAAAVIASPDVECSGKPAIVVKDVHARVRRGRVALPPAARAARAIGVSPLRHRQPVGQARRRTSTSIPAPRSATTATSAPARPFTPACTSWPAASSAPGVTLFPNAVLYENTRVGDRRDHSRRRRDRRLRLRLSQRRRPAPAFRAARPRRDRQRRRDRRRRRRSTAARTARR